MMYGYLRGLILAELTKKSLSGYDLIKKLGPSPGSIYPLLKDLLNKKLVGVKQSQRKNIYSITKQGKVFLKNFCQEKEKLLEKLKI